MKIEKVRIQNFRRYKDITFSLSNLNLLVGKNDAGKSTVLEALDIFFNEKGANKKIDKEDRQKESEEDIIISVCFSQFSDEVIIDETNKTSLKDEKFLNKNGQLEVRKKYAGMKESTFIYAEHPTAEKAKDLLLKKQKDLKKIVEDNNYSCNDKSKNAELRKSIWENCGELELKEVEIPIDKEDSKKIWNKLSGYLPIYTLFQSDRANNDSDTEVQDPIKTAIKSVLADEELQKTLNEVAEKVKEKIADITSKTLKKLEDMDSKIAQDLNIVIPETASLKWADVFKGIKISSDDDIPLNKRGSGVKRLVLLNFFRVEAEKEHENSRSIIYAIEEPETSQHLKYQELLMETFKQLSSKEGVQVFLTSHSTKIVKMLFSKDGQLSNNFKILHVKKNDKNGSNIDEQFKNLLPYTSANEINYHAFEVYEEEFHNELYGYLEESKKLKEIKNEDKTWINKAINKKYKVTLPEYIRNYIHHPENKENRQYDENELEASLELMLQIIKNKKL